jgi:Ca2+-binding EF-hand superfamily protein
MLIYTPLSFIFISVPNTLTYFFAPIVDNVELDAMYSQYLSLSTLDQDGGGITRLTFEQALGPLGLEKNLITDRIFRFFDQDDDETINFKEMACGLSVLCKGNFEEKITCK